MDKLADRASRFSFPSNIKGIRVKNSIDREEMVAANYSEEDEVASYDLFGYGLFLSEWIFAADGSFLAVGHWE